MYDMSDMEDVKHYLSGIDWWGVLRTAFRITFKVIGFVIMACLVITMTIVISGLAALGQAKMKSNAPK